MASKSKEELILKLILENSPLKHWRFEEFVKTTGMTKASVNKWLKKYVKTGILKKIKQKGNFPYYTCGKDNPVYLSKKKRYMLDKIYQSGLATHLLKLQNTNTIIIFGSIPRGDWYKDSDIDIFIYGKPKKIEKLKYERQLNRMIEFHVFETKEDIKRTRTGLFQNIINGYIIKGSIQDFAEVSC